MTHWSNIPSTYQQSRLYRHKKTGREYEVLGIGRMQSEDWVKPMRHDFVSIDMDEVVVYRATADGRLWVRPCDEFFDGRFEAIHPEIGLSRGGRNGN